MPHFDKSGWIIQEWRIVDFRGSNSTYMGNHPMLKLIQILVPVKSCDLLICCREDTMGILKYLMVWKPEWNSSKDLLRRLGWTMVDAAMTNPNPVEVPLGQFVKMNILMWNCKGALNHDFKRRIFEMAVNHNPAIVVITETRVGGERAAKIIADLPFVGYITMETISYVGGLWVFWKKEEADIYLLAATEQEIHAAVKVCCSNFTWFISAIYASPRLAKRRLVWSNLSEITKLHNHPWLMLGDFNEILSSEDKYGRNHINLNRALEFKDCLDNCNFLDLGFSGPKFTWTNKRPISSLILERLDGCFANPSWRMLYPEATVTQLPRTFLTIVLF